MKKKTQKIKCDVESCKHNVCEAKDCNLEEIKVSCNESNTQDKDTTICNSFESDVDCED